MAEMKLVEMKNIHKSFGKVVALQGVDFEIGPNEVVGLIGEMAQGNQH